MNNAERQALRKQSEDFALAHLRECAEELLEWSNTALLRDGKVRELAKLCAKYVDEHNALSFAETIVKHAALHAAAFGSGESAEGNCSGCAMSIQELIDYHQKQASHFEPFGANNVLSVFHRAAVETLRANTRLMREAPDSATASKET